MTLDQLNRMGPEQFRAVLGWIFEDSPWVAERAWAQRPFASRQALHRAMVEAVEHAGASEQRALLCAHPDLGTRVKVSAASAQEQAGAGLAHLTEDEYTGFGELNRAYRGKFGIPFLYAVKGSTKKDIFAALLVRLESSPEEEFHQALTEVYRIAWFRLESAIAE
ncbi:MAG: 2-oxo-4-hydroxy-4-carboxy-5-ureidoimidazoline decarboxylase [Acidobacteriia bacterium]|nr:2-oxo-4-hydroxy-4-carboxy-5-ureidoimidazoline decarboxylase [Terriglobia bacterium]